MAMGKEEIKINFEEYCAIFEIPKKSLTEKPKLDKQSLAKAKDYILNGGSLDTIKSKYVVSAAQEKTLKAAKA